MHLLEVRIHQENSYFGQWALLGSSQKACHELYYCMNLEMSKGVHIIPRNWQTCVAGELKEL